VVGTGTSLAIAIGVALVLGVVWWLFDVAPQESRRGRVTRTVGRWGESRRLHGWRRPLFVLWVILSLILLASIVWGAAR
jgi:hypothetical protein